MKRVFFTAILAALPAAAQWHHFGYEPPRLTGSIGIGVAAPVNPLARVVDPGVSVSGGIGVTGRYIGVLVDAMFTDLGLNDRALRIAGVPRGRQRYWALTVDPIFHVNQRGPVDFYVTGGGGIYGRNTRYYLENNFGPFPGSSQVLASYSDYKPGVDGGAGFAFNVGSGTHVKIFVEARYHHMFTRGSGSSFIPVTAGVRF